VVALVTVKAVAVAEVGDSAPAPEDTAVVGGEKWDTKRREDEAESMDEAVEVDGARAR
jgi:hypothetical protein